jgi:hypothetical protein
MSNPVNRKSAKYRKVLKQIASDGGFKLDGKNYGVIEWPHVGEGQTLNMSGKITIDNDFK